jgi:hypothetical protein
MLCSASSTTFLYLKKSAKIVKATLKTGVHLITSLDSILLLISLNGFKGYIKRQPQIKLLHRHLDFVLQQKELNPNP